MSRFKKYIGLATLVAIVAVLGITSMASAQTATPPAIPTAPMVPGGPGGGFGFGRGGGLHSQAALDAAAKTLSMTSDELSAQLWGGKTLAALADEKGVDIATVQKAVEAAILAETKTAIQDAVKAGTVTHDKADWLLQGLDKGYWGAGQGDFGLGVGMGPDGFGRGVGGPHGFGAPMGVAPNGVTPNSNGTTTPGTSGF
jgi:hypothetical protein